MELKIAWFVIALMTVASCSDSPVKLRGVTPDAYLDFASCWIDKDDRFTAFLILEQNRYGFRPHFVSSRCYVAEFGGALPLVGFRNLTGKKRFALLESLNRLRKTREHLP